MATGFAHIANRAMYAPPAQLLKKKPWLLPKFYAGEIPDES